MRSFLSFLKTPLVSGIVFGLATLPVCPHLFSQDLSRLLEDAGNGEQSEKQQPTLSDAVESTGNGLGSGKNRRPVPSQQEQRTSGTKIRDIYRRELASTASPSQKTQLARQLLEQSTADGNASDRYMLLDMASRLAIEAGATELLRECRSALMTEFAIDSAATSINDAEALASKAPVDMLANVIRFILDTTELDVSAGRLEAAESMAKAAALAARRSRDPTLTKTVNSRLADLRRLRKQEADLEPLLDRLATDPNDREAAKLVGMVRCFTQARWSEGIQLLAKGDDPKLARISAIELRQAGGNHVAAADAWWEYAAALKPTQKDAVRRHAADLYEVALPDLTGLEKVRVEKRLQEAKLGTDGGEQAVYLADMKESDVAGAKFGFSKDGTYMGKSFTCINQKWPKAITAITDGNAPAVVRYEVPVSVSRIQGRVGVFSPSDAKPEQQPGGALVFEVVADGKVVWRSAPMTKRDMAQPFRADLRGATSIELRTHTKSGYCAWGAWLDPQIVR